VIHEKAERARRVFAGKVDLSAHVGSVFVADTPCDENSASSTCPAPGFPPNFLGELNPWTGAIAPVPLLGPAVQPQGMLFVP
jgi:hypothetical protein